MSKKLSLNGRFLNRPSTGVDRVARELVNALSSVDQELQIDIARPTIGGNPIPHGSIVWGSTRISETITKRLPLKGHLWEQLFLPFWRKRTTLLNLCSTGPILRRNQLIMIHDAQVWDVPESYSRNFVRLYRFLVPILCRRSEYVVTVSEYSKSRLAYHGVAPLEKISVVHNGVDHMADVVPDHNALERHSLTENAYFLVLGSQAPHKNIGLLIDVFAELDPERFRLVIAGSKDHKVFSDGKRGADPANIIRVGRVSDEELKALYIGATALLFPSKTEGFGLPPLEAMFCRCPAIVSSGGAIPEVCGEAAVYVDPEDAVGWRDAIKRMAANPDHRAAYSALGATKATSYKWNNSAKMLLSALQRTKKSAVKTNSTEQVD